MIATARSSSATSKNTNAYDEFLTMLPRNLTHAAIASAGWSAEAREDAIQEVVANCYVAFARLVEQDRSDLAYPFSTHWLRDQAVSRRPSRGRPAQCAGCDVAARPTGQGIQGPLVGSEARRRRRSAGCAGRGQNSRPGRHRGSSDRRRGCGSGGSAVATAGSLSCLPLARPARRRPGDSASRRHASRSCGKNCGGRG